MSSKRKIRRSQYRNGVSRLNTHSGGSKNELVDMLASKVADGEITQEELIERLRQKSQSPKYNKLAAQRKILESLREKYTDRRDEYDNQIKMLEEHTEWMNDCYAIAATPVTRHILKMWLDKYQSSDNFLEELISMFENMDPKQKVASHIVLQEMLPVYPSIKKYENIIAKMLHQDFGYAPLNPMDSKDELSGEMRETAQKVYENLSIWLNSVSDSPNCFEKIHEFLSQTADSGEKLIILQMIMSAKSKYKFIEDNWWELKKIERELEYEVNGHAIMSLDGARNFVNEFFDNPKFDITWVLNEKEMSFNKLYQIFQTVRADDFSERFPGDHELVAQRIFTALLERVEKLPIKEDDKQIWRNICAFAIKWYKDEPGVREELSHFEKITHESLIPAKISTNNLEIRYMSYARLEFAINSSQYLDGATFPYFTKDPKVQDILMGMNETMGHGDRDGTQNKKEQFAFAKEWRKSGFSRIEISHKLAAALSLTDAPSGKIESPWDHWSLIVPTDMLQLKVALSADDDAREIIHEGHTYTITLDTHIERIWCIGCEPKFVAFKMNLTGTKDGQPCSIDQIPDNIDRVDIGSTRTSLKKMLGTITLGNIDSKFEEMYDGTALINIMNNLVKGVCLCISDRQVNRKGSWGAVYGPKASKRKKGPPGAGERYVLGKSISIDLRQELKDVLSGKTRANSGPKVQFLVRGHWRNQAHGKGRKLHRKIWIEPFWKGNEETRVLLRTYEVDNE